MNLLTGSLGGLDAGVPVSLTCLTVPDEGLERFLLNGDARKEIFPLPPILLPRGDVNCVEATCPECYGVKQLSREGLLLVQESGAIISTSVNSLISFVFIDKKWFLRSC